MVQRLVFENELFNDNTFQHACNYFVNSGMKQIVHDNVLSIEYEDRKQDKKVYYVLEGETNIKNYKNGLLNKSMKMFHGRDIINDIIFDNFDYTCVLQKSEDELIESEDILIDDKLKIFKITRTYEYKDTNENKTYKIVLESESVSSEYRFKDVKMDKMLSYKYIIEFEDVNDDIDTLIREMTYILDGNIHSLMKDKQREVIESYFKMVKGVYNTRYDRDLSIDKVKMLTPKPATLERVNILQNDMLGLISIADNYAVTEKADGERYLLYIDNEGDGYLIDGMKKVRGIGIKNKEIKNTLIDGELVMCDNRFGNNDKDLFAMFDIYFYNGKKTLDLPLINQKESKSRYSTMKEVVKMLKSDTHDITVKEQMVSDEKVSIFDRCVEILDKFERREYDYEIDGLIFTPTRLPVFGIYANKPVELNPNNVSWGRVFKWKPHTQNSIDFVVMDTGNVKVYSGFRYREYILYVVSRKDNEDIDVLEGLRRMTVKKKDEVQDKGIYELVEFQSKDMDDEVDLSRVHIKINEDDNRCYTNGMEDIIMDNTVVEFTYDDETPLISNERRWVPIRVRHDKNRMYKNGKGELNQTANSLMVALNVWRSIKMPITLDMIKGIDKIVGDGMNMMNADEKYYNRLSDRNNSGNVLITSKMNAFHNHIIKDMLFKYPKMIGNTRGNLLELACGQGSDLRRWTFNRYKSVLGIDYFADNIKNFKSGVYRRYLNDMINIELPKMVFLVGDCSKQIRNGECSKSLDRESYDLLRYVYGRGRPIQKYTNLNIYPGMFNDINVVSCMFSIHYFFESETSLRKFLDNVVSNMKSGYFILTFMDGVKVEALLNENNGSVKGIDEDSNAVIWAIISKYNMKSKMKYGKKIDVYLENTGKLIQENIVDFETLVNVCDEKGLKLSKTETFDITYNNYKNKNNKNNHIFEEMEKNKILKTFSFLNRWCIFETK